MNNETPIKDREAFLQLLGEFGAGAFVESLVASFKATALATAVHGDKGKKGQVVVTFDMARIGESLQLQVNHKIAIKAPTARGKRSEEAANATPVYVGRTGSCTILPPQEQGGLFRTDTTSSTNQSE